MILVRVAAALAVLALAVAVGGPWLVMAVAPDHDAPPEVERLLPEAKSTLAGQLDQPTSVIRYIGWEHRERDDLVILMFEMRPFPHIVVDGAYLASRCVPIEDVDATGMSGGRGVVDFVTDPELEHLRSDAQPACP